MMTDTKRKSLHVFVKAAHFIFSFKKVCFNENNSAAASEFLRTGIQLNFIFPQNCKIIFFLVRPLREIISIFPENGDVFQFLQKEAN